MKKARLKLLHGLIYFLFILFAILIILPLIWMVITGFKTNKELFLSPFALPRKWEWENYVNAWNSGIGMYLKNSLLVTVISTLLSTSLSCFAAYPLSRLHFKSKRFWVYLIMGGLMLAPQSSLISLYKMINWVHLLDTQLALEVVNAVFRIPFATFLIMTFYKGISYSLDESAYIDGARTGQIFCRIILPLSKPIIASCSIISFRAVWNELMFANVLLQSSSKKTVPLGLINMQGMTTTNWTEVIAGTVIASVPLIIAFLLMQKQFVRGLTAGSVKG
ncbi:MAG TPA: carbohydrate ABC transporter permease [Clostridiales bacterium]|nr:carbohydrate ABC transporter permease [Clostridiales bacterium]